MNYSEFVTRLEVLTQGKLKDHPISIPAIIAYAENRMYRELDLPGTYRTRTGTFTADTRELTINADIIVLQSMSTITPVGVNSTDPNAKRNPLQRVSMEFLNVMWPRGQDNDTDGIPKYYAMLNATAVTVAPAPDAGYTVEFLGTTRPTPLSTSNTETTLTVYCPDTFLQCCLVFTAQTYGVGDPQAAEAAYQASKESIGVEVARQKSQSSQWTAFVPTKLATPPRA